jgi:hypothetical protein
MRIFLAGLIGGLVFWLWGAVAHMALPIGEMGMRAPGDEAAVVAALRSGLPGEGVYYLPYLAPAQMQDETATRAYSARALDQPYAFVVYQPQGRDPMAMGANMAIQFGSGLLAAWVLAYVLSLGASGFARRVALSAGLGLFAWLAISVPYWNWYRFPLDFTIATLLEQGIGWALAGASMAWWLGRGRR